MIVLQKDELIFLLRDPDVCQEILGIVQRGGIPLPLDAPIGNNQPESDFDYNIIDQPFVTPTETIQTPPAMSQKINQPTTTPITNSTDRERILALRQKMWQAMNEKKLQPEQVLTPEVAEALRQRLKQAREAKEAEKKAAEAKETEKQAGEEIPANIQAGFADKLKVLREQAQKIQAEKAALAAVEAEKSPQQISAEKYAFVIERPCPICEEKTRVIHTKSRLITESQDLDLCTHYKDFNPYLYNVWACEHCGFAAEETKFRGHIPQRTKDKIRAFLQTNNLAQPFIEERTTEDALSFYEIAILFSEIFEPSPGRQANLYQKMAWCLRYKEPYTDKEKEYLRKAAELYEMSLETERYPIGKMTDDMAQYIISAIYFLLEDYDSAVKQLSRIMNNQTLRATAPKIFEKARDMWQDIKRIKSVQEKNDALLQSVIKKANA